MLNMQNIFFKALVSKLEKKNKKNKKPHTLESHRITKDGEGICCPSLTYHLSRNIYFLNIIISPSGLPW